MHAGQRRTDGGPFFSHPLEVASLLDYAEAPDHLIAAGVLHDLLEKTEVSPSDLMLRFGSRITRLVLAVSEDDRIVGHAKRKAALRQQVAGSGDDALALFAADKLSKVRELRREAELDDASAAGVLRARRAPAACGTISGRWRCSRSVCPIRRWWEISATSCSRSWAGVGRSPRSAERLPADAAACRRRWAV
jgi:HD domain